MKEKMMKVKTKKMTVKKTKVMSPSMAAKKAIKGTDMGKKGKNFNKIAKSAGKEYGSAKAGKKVAGAIFQNMRKSGKL